MTLKQKLQKILYESRDYLPSGGLVIRKDEDVADAILFLIREAVEESNPSWKQSVGMLRQWLNERPNPKELVTNEQIEVWFSDYHKALMGRLK